LPVAPPRFRPPDFRALVFFAAFLRLDDERLRVRALGFGVTAATARRPTSATTPAAVLTTLPTVLAALPTPDVTVSMTPPSLGSAIVPPGKCRDATAIRAALCGLW
jgi:hypothetical protein